jgi:hypothetical protein
MPHRQGLSADTGRLCDVVLMRRDESQHLARGLLRRRVPSAGGRKGPATTSFSNGRAGVGGGAASAAPSSRRARAAAGADSGPGGSRRQAKTAPSNTTGYGSADMYSELDEGAAVRPKILPWLEL